LRGLVDRARGRPLDRSEILENKAHSRAAARPGAAKSAAAATLHRVARAPLQRAAVDWSMKVLSGPDRPRSCSPCCTAWQRRRATNRLRRS